MNFDEFKTNLLSNKGAACKVSPKVAGNNDMSFFQLF